MSTYPEHYGDNFIPVIRGATLEHTQDRPFCADPNCLCHELDTDAIASVQQWYMDGLITTQDATRIVQGLTV